MLVQSLTQMQERGAASKEALVQLEARSTEGERTVSELTARLESLAGQRQQLAEKITASRVRAGELAQRRSSVAEAMRELHTARIQIEADRDKAQRDVAEAQERIEQSQRQMEGARQLLEQLTRDHADLTQQSRSLREERDGLRASLDQLAADARLLRSELEKVEADLHERQIKLQEIRVRTEDLVSRIAEELSVNLAEQYATYTPETEENWPAVEEEINDLRAKLERLGNVNLDAIDEQAELEKRQSFLGTQLADLRTSEKQLVELIERLNVESQQRFLDTFQSVAEHFSALFKKLFGGGKAELTLMDAADVLECGIEIMARPPGKEPQSISLLSGGEKTLTAIALLMAVFRSRPSPFVLMDEVDAALDEANNNRFNHVVQEFVKLSQFIVITHSKRTMSIADVMYGITMQEAGVSKRVSVRFEDDQKQPAVA
jgi:chromosome segregation protein